MVFHAVEYQTYAGDREQTVVMVYTNKYVYISIHMHRCGSTKAIQRIS